MNQPIPTIHSGDIERVVRRDFSTEEVPNVLATLAIYGTKAWHKEENRVRMAVLKIARGNLVQLRVWCDVANEDYRDVLAAAEYPAYMKKIKPSEKNSTKIQTAIKKDAEEYRKWFTNKH